MIRRLFSPPTASPLFPAERLPEAVHGPVLQAVMTPIVHSDSMLPTIQKGDGLGLEEATDLKVGDVVVYRHDQFFICHRIHRIEGPRLFLRGDATTGPLDEVDLQSVIGRVRFLSRAGNQLPVSPFPYAPSPKDASIWTRLSTRSLALGRSSVTKLIQWVLDQPGITHVVRMGLRRCMTVEVMERASLNSIEGYLYRQRLRFNESTQTQHDQSLFYDKNIVLLVRLGPLYLGICTLAPWSVQMRPFLQGLATDALVESLELIGHTHAPRHSRHRSTPDHGMQ